MVSSAKVDTNGSPPVSIEMDLERRDDSTIMAFVKFYIKTHIASSI